MGGNDSMCLACVCVSVHARVVIGNEHLECLGLKACQAPVCVESVTGDKMNFKGTN